MPCLSASVTYRLLPLGSVESLLVGEGRRRNDLRGARHVFDVV